MVSGDITVGDIDSFVFGAACRRGGAHPGGRHQRRQLLSEALAVQPGRDPEPDRCLTATTAELDCYSTSSVCRLNQTGTYRLVVTDNYNDRTGSYDIHYARVPETNENGALVNDGVVSGDISVGDIDSFVFGATAGEAAHIRVVDINGDSFYPKLWLYNPDGTLNRTDCDGTTAELDCYSTSSTCRLNQTGTYRLVVTDNYNDRTGSYDIHYARRAGNERERGAGQRRRGQRRHQRRRHRQLRLRRRRRRGGAHPSGRHQRRQLLPEALAVQPGRDPEPDRLLTGRRRSWTAIRPPALCRLKQTGTYRLVVTDYYNDRTGDYEILMN